MKSEALYPLAKRFIAGYDLASAGPNVQQLMDDGFRVSIDYVGERSKTTKVSKSAFKQYLKIINFFKGKPIDISIKPTQLGLLIDPLTCRRYLDRIAQRAMSAGHTIRLDMEESKVTAYTVELAIFLNDKYKNVGVAIQSNLLRTKWDIDALIKQGVSIRLVKGAYKEHETKALQDEGAVKIAFFEYAKQLKKLEAKKPAIATHDERLLKNITNILEPLSDGHMDENEHFEYEFLYGVRRDLQKKIKNDGYPVRIYVPFGADWIPYTIRRLKEWKNLKFVLKNILEEWRNNIKRMKISG